MCLLTALQSRVPGFLARGVRCGVSAPHSLEHGCQPSVLPSTVTATERRHPITIITSSGTGTTPRVWVGCLACCNAGRLVGDWSYAATADEVRTEGCFSALHNPHFCCAAIVGASFRVALPFVEPDTVQTKMGETRRMQCVQPRTDR